MTTEEQRLALRKRVCPLTELMLNKSQVEQFIPTINGIFLFVSDARSRLLVRNSTTNILAKYKDAAPSLIVHLHPTHFRFEQQVYIKISEHI